MLLFVFFFFNDTATTEIYTLSLHDALPISSLSAMSFFAHLASLSSPLTSIVKHGHQASNSASQGGHPRSEEHTSELQSQSNLVCRLLLEKKKRIHHQRHECHQR